MSEKKLLPILQWWVGESLSTHYTFGLSQKELVKAWLVHPVKRRIAKYYVAILKLLGVKIIGITGSVGKTTSKEMIASVLAQKYKTQFSFANIDPVFNIPSTLLKAPLGTQKIVLEMGVEYLGDMAFYNWIAKPDIGVLLNVYWTHTEFLGGIEGVQKEKGKLIERLSRTGYAILNADDERVISFAKSTKGKVISFGIKKKADVMAKNITLTEDFKTKFTLSMYGEEAEILLPILGKHFVYAALVAATVGYVEKVPVHLIKKGLELFNQPAHRMTPSTSKSGAIVLDDTYNSNPLGAKAAIDVLVEIGKGRRKIAVLGDMLELGEYTQAGHNEVGEYVSKLKVDVLICIGGYAEYLAVGAFKNKMNSKNVMIFADKNLARSTIKRLTDSKSVVLFKASRKLKFEELVDYCK